MLESSTVRRLFLAAAGWISLAGGAPAASACSPVKFADDGRYVGGDLITQVARKADTIQIVTVTERYLVSRRYSVGWWYLSYGDTDLPPEFPEYRDEFAFKLEVVETLKREADPDYPVYDSSLRIEGSDSVWGEDIPTRTGDFDHPNRLPSWLLERPGDDGYAFTAASPHGGTCAMGYVLEVGQKFVALRNSGGRLYPASGAFPLEIDAEFRWQSGRTERFPLRMQSLVPISGPDDVFVQGLRAAITTGG